MYTEFEKRFKKIETMTPKEKAEELCFKFQGEFEMNWTMSKRCALISVDEILIEVNRLDEKFNLRLDGTRQYWKEVKQEIKKL